jgi:hypothetical protein
VGGRLAIFNLLGAMSTASSVTPPASSPVEQLSKVQSILLLTGLLAFGLLGALCEYLGSQNAKAKGFRVFSVLMRSIAITFAVGSITLYLVAIIFVLRY